MQENRLFSNSSSNGVDDSDKKSYVSHDNDADQSSSLLDVLSRSEVKASVHEVNAFLVLCHVGMQTHTLMLASQLGSGNHHILGNIEW